MPKYVVDSRPASPEFGCVGLTDDNRAVSLQSFDEDVRARSNTIREDPRPFCPTHATDRCQVLDDDREAEQKSGPCGTLRDAPCMIPRPLEALNGNCIEQRLDPGDATLRLVNKFERRRFPPPQQIDRVPRGQTIEIT